eukprot:TRINITY_DN2066_c0_g1_i2.p1 TRINITY_DN2066_c0_g1~~TRINITY_DN2066_c0_g1_i2.p1  ORF type:complete len:263 (-),score=50.76 TRINITY_DN2066_c0_g1_i2:1007-1795(-)
MDKWINKFEQILDKCGTYHRLSIKLKDTIGACYEKSELSNVKYVRGLCRDQHEISIGISQEIQKGFNCLSTDVAHLYDEDFEVIVKLETTLEKLRRTEVDERLLSDYDHTKISNLTLMSWVHEEVPRAIQEGYDGMTALQKLHIHCKQSGHRIHQREEIITHLFNEMNQIKIQELDNRTISKADAEFNIINSMTSAVETDCKHNIESIMGNDYEREYNLVEERVLQIVNSIDRLKSIEKESKDKYNENTRILSACYQLQVGY